MTACVFFVLSGVDPEALAVTEGTAIVLSLAEAEADARLTPACRAMAARMLTRQPA
jgi:glutathione S-transferase